VLIGRPGPQLEAKTDNGIVAVQRDLANGEYVVFRRLFLAAAARPGTVRDLDQRARIANQSIMYVRVFAARCLRCGKSSKREVSVFQTRVLLVVDNKIQNLI
jgi:hypothetical protein